MPKEEAPQVQALSTGDRQIFLDHLTAVSKAMQELEDVLRAAKEDGFVAADFRYALAVVEAEKELKAKAAIRRRILIASFVDSDVDPQLNLFPEQPTTPEIVPAGFAPFTADEVSNY